MLVD
jgi:hypothetical protein